MKNTEWKEWTKAAGIRAVKTMAQTAASMLTVGQAVMDVNWANVASISFVAGVISVLTSVFTGLPEVAPVQQKSNENAEEERKV